MPLLGALLLLGLALLCTCRLARRRHALPTATALGRPRSLPALPLLGSLLQLAGHPQLHLRLWRLQGHYGSLYALWMGSHYVVVVNSYRHAREVLLKKGKDFAGRPRTVSRQQVLGIPSHPFPMLPRKTLARSRVRVPSPSCPQPARGRAAPRYPGLQGEPCASSIPRVLVFPAAGCIPGHGHVGSGTTRYPLSSPEHPRAPNLRICPQTSLAGGKQSSCPVVCLPALTPSPPGHPWDGVR